MTVPTSEDFSPARSHLHQNVLYRKTKMSSFSKLSLCAALPEGLGERVEGRGAHGVRAAVVNGVASGRAGLEGSGEVLTPSCLPPPGLMQQM